MRDLDVAVVQAELVWEDPAANREHLGEMLQSLKNSDVVVLPEMFTTGFSVASTAEAETMEGPSIEWMRTQAAEGGFALTGSVKISVDGRCYNRMIWITADGALRHYDKRHLFRMAGEQKRYTAGDSRVIVDYCGWRILMQVCYDLRFPVWSRNCEDYDLVIYVANWPAARRNAWRALLPARAIENLSYCVGVNRIGQDGNQIAYAGDSAIIDYKGEALVDLGGSPGVESTTLSGKELLSFREKFPAHRDADRFSIEL